jgi:hypothetical protein
MRGPELNVGRSSDRHHRIRRGGGGRIAACALKVPLRQGALGRSPVPLQTDMATAGS